MLIERKKLAITKVRICDVCEDRTAYKKCRGCGIDLCPHRDCSYLLWTDPFTMTDAGDYPDSVCKSCNDKLTDIRNDIAELHNEFDKAIDKLENQWLTACKNNTES